jgi:hypothetical protein
VSAFELAAVQRVVDEGLSMGIQPPPEIVDVLNRLSTDGFHWMYPARRWQELHPDDDRPWCCEAAANDSTRCTCWVAEYDDVQSAELQPVTCLADLAVRPRGCSDCAYLPGSAERREAFLADELMAAPAEGRAFYCHDGMRRPARWRHPDGRVVDGHPDAWEPPIAGGVPYRLDGSPALLCAGWAARAAAPVRRADTVVSTTGASS